MNSKALEGIPSDYQARIVRAIENDLTELQLHYDTRVLAVLLMARSVYLLRALVAAGKWKSEDVQTVVMEALADLHVPLDTKPREMKLRPNDQTGSVFD